MHRYLNMGSSSLVSEMMEHHLFTCFWNMQFKNPCLTSDEDHHCNALGKISSSVEKEQKDISLNSKKIRGLPYSSIMG